MSLFRREERSFFNGDPTYNPFERPSVPLASVALDTILGGGSNSDAGEAVDPLRGLGLPTVYRCISVISTVVASCPIEIVTSNGPANPWTVIQNLQSYTAYEIVELMVTHMAGWGNFYAYKVLAPGSSTRLLDLQPIFPGYVHVLNVNGQKIFRIRRAADPSQPNGPAVYVDKTEDEVFHIPFLGFDGLQGLSPIMAATQTIGTSIGADRLAARFQSQGQQMSGVIKVKNPLANQQQADAIKQRWGSRNSGVRNAGGVVVLDSETDFQPLTINPDSLQLIESRTWQMQEIARIFGVPLTMLSTNSTGYGDAIETQQIGFVTYTVRQYTDRIEQRLSREFTPRGSNVRFDLDSLMRGSMSERFTAYGLAIASGWMTRNEPRLFENMQPLPAKAGVYDLDEPFVPQIMSGIPQVPPLSDPSAPPPAPPTPPPSDDSDDDESDDDDSSDDSGDSAGDNSDS